MSSSITNNNKNSLYQAVTTAMMGRGSAPDRIRTLVDETISNLNQLEDDNSVEEEQEGGGGLTPENFIMPYEIDVAPCNYLIRNVFMVRLLTELYKTHTSYNNTEGDKGEFLQGVKELFYGKHFLLDLGLDLIPGILKWIGSISKERMENSYRFLNWITERITYFQFDIFYYQIWVFVLLIGGILPSFSMDWQQHNFHYNNWRIATWFYLVLYCFVSNGTKVIRNEMIQHRPQLFAYFHHARQELEYNIILFFLALQMQDHLLNLNTIFTWLFFKHWWDACYTSSKLNYKSFLFHLILFLGLFFPQFALILYIVYSSITMLTNLQFHITYPVVLFRGIFFAFLAFIGLVLHGLWAEPLHPFYFQVFWIGDVLLSSFSLWNEFYIPKRQFIILLSDEENQVMDDEMIYHKRTIEEHFTLWQRWFQLYTRLCQHRAFSWLPERPLHTHIILIAFKYSCRFMMVFYYLVLIGIQTIQVVIETKKQPNKSKES